MYVCGRNFSFEDVHVTGGRTLARLARECGVDRFVQMSHLAAQHDPPRFFTKTGSRFLRTKVTFIKQILLYSTLIFLVLVCFSMFAVFLLLVYLRAHCMSCC